MSEVRSCVLTHSHVQVREYPRHITCIYSRSCATKINELTCSVRNTPPAQLSMFTSEWESSGKGARACQSTAADFMVDLVGDPKSVWNVSAG